MATFQEMIRRNHEQVSYFYDEDTGLKCIIGVHNTILGPGLGGCRIWNYNNEQEALIDVLKHDPKDKKYKLKDFENFARIEGTIFTQKSVRPNVKNKNT